MKLRKILGASLIPLNTLLLFFLIFEDRVLVPVWLQVFGRMHPLFLHFPIVLTVIFVALLFVNARRLRESGDGETYANWFLLFSAVTCSITALMGFFLAKDGGYEEDVLSLHKWSGAALPLLLHLLFIFRNTVFRSVLVARGTALLLVTFITVAAHFGGVITHGDNFVFQPLSSEKSRPVPTLEEAIVFADLVQPILDKKCVSCHNTGKAKGELIMETKEQLLKGGKNGKLWDTTDADLGLMLKRIHLPEDDKKHMPPPGKPQLTEDEVSVLQLWVRSGASFEQRVAERDPDDTLMLIAKKILKPSDELQFDFPHPEEKLVRELSNNNRIITPFATGSPALRVNFYNSEYFRSQDLKELDKLSRQIVELNLINMPVKDEDLAHIKAFPNLRRLYLNFTPLTGSSLSELKGLDKLQVLSLTGTKVGYEHLRSLREMRALHTVYLWNTAISEEQIAELRKQDKRVAYQTGFSGDALIMQLTPPMIENEEQVIDSSLPLILRHNITGTTIRYTLDGSDPDSVSSPVYKEEVPLRSSVIVKVKAFKKGWISSDIRERYFFKSTYRPDTVILQTLPTDRYKAAGAKTLYDGEKSDLNYGSNKWLGFRDTKLSALLVLDSATEVKNVTLSVLRDHGAFIFPPAQVEIWGGADEKQLRLLKKITPDQGDKMMRNLNAPIECDFDPVKIKVIKVVAQPVGKIPSWHFGKGQKANLFVDEIFIN